MKTRTLLLSALSVGLGLIACDNFVESRSGDAPETATLAARLTASGDAEKALLKKTQSVQVTLDTGTSTLVRCLQKTVAYDSGKVSFPALRVGMNYALTYEGLVGSTVIWKGTASGTLAKNGNTANLTFASTDLQLKAPTIQLNTTLFYLTSNTDTSLGAKLYWTRTKDANWTPYDAPFAAKKPDTVWAKDSIENEIGSEVKFLTVSATGEVLASTTTALKSLSVAEAEAAIAFDSAKLDYTISVPSGTTKVSITADTAAVNQSIKIEGVDAIIGGLTPVTIPSDSTIDVVVTNSKNTTELNRTYKITVKVSALPDTSRVLSSLKCGKATWNPQFTSNVTTYTLTVDDTVTSLPLVAKAKSSSATISAKLGITTLSPTDAVPAGSGKTITVAKPSATTNLTITVTNPNAPTSSQTITYVIKFVIKDTPKLVTLSALVPTNGKLTPTFNPLTETYDDTVPASFTAESFTATATAGTTAAVTGTGSYALGTSGSSTPATITVANGTSSKVYKVNIIRAQPAKCDTTLKSLVPTVGKLVPDFTPGNQIYTLDLPYDTNIVTFNSVATDSRASVPPVTNADLSLKHDGETALTTIDVKNGGFTLTYKITVKRASIPWSTSVGTWGTLDYGGRTYKTVSIGTQTWMAENLNYAGTGTTPLGTCYLYSVVDTCARFGRLYTWAEAMGLDTSNNSTKAPIGDTKYQGICPAGWHVPNDADWKTLADYATILNSAEPGTALKAQKGWKANGTASGNGTDATGFRALPTGWLDPQLNGFNIGKGALWVSATQIAESSFQGIALYHDNTEATTVLGTKTWSYPLRCIKD